MNAFLDFFGPKSSGRSGRLIWAAGGEGACDAERKRCVLTARTVINAREAATAEIEKPQIRLLTAGVNATYFAPALRRAKRCQHARHRNR